MTGHLLVSLLTLALLCWLLWRLAKSGAAQKTVSWLPLAAAVIVLLPASFGEIIPISHFVFESTTDNLLWFGIVYGILWLLTGWFLWRIRAVQPCSTDRFLYGVIWVTMGFWYVLGLTLSTYEPGGKTPHMRDAGIYMAHWSSVLLVVLCLFLLLFRSSAYPRSWLRTTISIALLIAFLLVVRGSLV